MSKIDNTKPPTPEMPETPLKSDKASHEGRTVETAEPEQARVAPIESLPVKAAHSVVPLKNITLPIFHTLQVLGKGAYEKMTQAIAFEDPDQKQALDEKIFGQAAELFFDNGYNKLTPPQKEFVHKHREQNMDDLRASVNSFLEDIANNMVFPTNFVKLDLSKAQNPEEKDFIIHLTTFMDALDKANEILPQDGQITPVKAYLSYLSNAMVTNPNKELIGIEQVSYRINDPNYVLLSREICQLTFLKELFIERTNISFLPPEFGKLTELEYFVIEGNNLTSLPVEIGNLTQLEVLRLSGNKLTSLPAEIGNLTKLEKLELRNNPLTSLPPELGNLRNLQTLDLTKTLIQWDATLEKLHQNGCQIIGIKRDPRFASTVS